MNYTPAGHARFRNTVIDLNTLAVIILKKTAMATHAVITVNNNFEKKP